MLMVWLEDYKMALATPVLFWKNELPKMTITNVSFPRGCSSCLLPLPEALQDQPVGLTQALFKLLFCAGVCDIFVHILFFFLRSK